MEDSRSYAQKLLNRYFKTFEYPFTHHQLNSYNEFIAKDIPAIIKANNPILLLENKIANTDEYAYKIEIFIGGIEGNKFYIGTPTISLKNDKEIRVMYPNEARLRNLTYGSNIETDITVRITFTRQNDQGKLESTIVLLEPNNPQYAYLSKIPLLNIPIMIHSKYFILNNKFSIKVKSVN